MASPHAAGVAALIVSQFGRLAQGRRRRSRARHGRVDPRALGDRHRPDRLRHVLRERADRRAPGRGARLLGDGTTPRRRSVPSTPSRKTRRVGCPQWRSTRFASTGSRSRPTWSASRSRSPTRAWRSSGSTSTRPTAARSSRSAARSSCPSSSTATSSCTTRRASSSIWRSGSPSRRSSHASPRAARSCAASSTGSTRSGSGRRT